MNQTQTSDTRTRPTASSYNRRDPASAAARFDRLLKAASRGETLSQFARAEGITVQTLNSWLAAHPAYADQVAHMRRGPKAEVTGAEEQRRLAAVRHKRAGLRWKQAARLAGVDVVRVQSWYYRTRPEVVASGGCVMADAYDPIADVWASYAAAQDALRARYEAMTLAGLVPPPLYPPGSEASA